MMFPWKNIFLLLYFHSNLACPVTHHNDHCSNTYYLKYLEMSPGRNEEPGSPLSNIDLVKFLMNDSLTKVQELRQNVKEDFAIDRQHNKKIIETVVTGLCKRLDSLEVLVKERVERIEAVEDLDLKLTTITTYNEGLLHNLSQKVHDLSSELQYLTQSQSCQVIRCTFCDYSFKSRPDLDTHIQQYHTQQSSLLCTSCGYVFQTENDLRSHQCEPLLRYYSTIPITLNPYQEYYANNYTESQNVCPCKFCEQAYLTTPHLQDHISKQHSEERLQYHTSASYNAPHCNASAACMCAICASSHNSLSILSNHNHSYHENLSPIHCNLCEHVFYDMRQLNIHVREQHQPLSYNVTEHPRDDCDDHDPSSSTNLHSARPSNICFSPIGQFDGNISPTDPAQPMARQTYSDAAVITTGSVTSNPSPVIQLPYTLNSVNQAKRLIENTQRSAFSIRYNNPQTIKGLQHPTNVSVDCNTGVYLSAVKPVLEAIVPGWQQEADSTLITCEDKSDRTEFSGRKVSTKLVLFLTENSAPSVKSKVVLHFYHTSSTLQAQGSALLTAGVTTPVWLVNNFLEPLATCHVMQNRESIEAINNTVIESGYVCNHCNDRIIPTASHPKDQELSCTQCGNHYHKKCTNRRKSTANWKKSPWFCQLCILGSKSQSREHLSDQQAVHHSPQALDQCPPVNPAANVLELQLQPLTVSQHHPSPTVPVVQSLMDPHTKECEDLPMSQQNTHNALQYLHPPTQGDLSQAQDTAPNLVITAAPVHSTPESSTMLTPAVNNGLGRRPPFRILSESASQSQVIAVPHGRTQEAVTVSSSSSQTASQQTPSFPTTATRQRSSNVNTSNAELEFTKTALSSCRSTISQQESELKRLKETLEIRNKRIVQLELMVSHASDNIAARHPNNNSSDDGLNGLSDKVDELLRKMDVHLGKVPAPSSNIVINSCHASYSQSKKDSSSQTATQSGTDTVQDADPPDSLGPPSQSQPTL